MRALVQRVSRASVTVEGVTTGSIGAGLCVLVGVTHSDTDAAATGLARRVAGLRVFADDEGRMDRSVVDTGGAALVVSQFTLYGDTSRGRRPSWSAAAPGDVAEPLVERFCAALRAEGVDEVATGVFGAMMSVELVNEGPVTLMVEA
ncbi:MAG TPA: D-aminoacyl-tRNA deacylase [Acidimicrobiales bacterium]|nr:D-aminoacyl-tRNA deacylase [Acidimicrobiales bacterium]